MACWILLLAFDSYREEDHEATPVVATGLVCLGLTVAVYSFMQLIWNNYLFSATSIAGAVVSIGCLTGYQATIVFYHIEHERFLPFSGFFLNLTLLCMTPIVFLSYYGNAKTSKNVFDAFFKPSGIKVDRNRKTDLMEEIKEQEKDPNWQTSKEELQDVMTMAYVSNEQF
jgi:hypothetical protein